MEELWDDSGPYALAKLCDRLVPVPRDSETPVSLYALCRAWVRNNPVLPLTADAPSPLPQLAGAVGASKSGGALQGGQQQPEQHGLQEPQQSGLLSILPPLLPPTQLETETTVPMYPLDDFEAQGPEDALRKLKDHWVGVRQYHQAVRQAKLSRHRERLQVLLGEPSMLTAQAQANAQAAAAAAAAAAPAQQQHQHQQADASGMAANGAPAVQHLGPGGFQGALLLPDQPGGPPAQGGLVGGQPLTGAGVHAALASIASLGQPTTAGQASHDAAVPPQAGGGSAAPGIPNAPPPPQLLVQLPHAGASHAVANGGAVAAAVPSMDMLMTLQLQLPQLPQGAGPVQAQPAVTAPAATTGAEMEYGVDAEETGGAHGSAVPAGTQVADVLAKQEPGAGTCSGPDGASKMDIDAMGPGGT